MGMTIRHAFQLRTLQLFLQRFGFDRVLRTNNLNTGTRGTNRLNLQSVVTGNPIQRRGTYRQMTTNSKKTSILMRLPRVMWYLTTTSMRTNRQINKGSHTQNHSTRLRDIQHMRTTSYTLYKTNFLRSNMRNKKVNNKYHLMVGNRYHTNLRNFRTTNRRAMTSHGNSRYSRNGTRSRSRCRTTNATLFFTKEYRGGSSFYRGVFCST